MEPCILHHSSHGYTALEFAAAALTFASPGHVRYKVQDVYFDYGQNWMWTTIVAERPNGDSWQALYPRDWEKLVTSDSIIDIVATVKAIGNDKFNPDKWEGE